MIKISGIMSALCVAAAWAASNAPLDVSVTISYFQDANNEEMTSNFTNYLISASSYGVASEATVNAGKWLAGEMSTQSVLASQVSRTYNRAIRDLINSILKDGTNALNVTQLAQDDIQLWAGDNGLKLVMSECKNSANGCNFKAQEDTVIYVDTILDWRKYAWTLLHPSDESVIAEDGWFAGIGTDGGSGTSGLIGNIFSNIEFFFTGSWSHAVIIYGGCAAKQVSSGTPSPSNNCIAAGLASLQVSCATVPYACTVVRGHLVPSMESTFVFGSDFAQVESSQCSSWTVQKHTSAACDYKTSVSMK